MPPSAEHPTPAEPTARSAEGARPADGEFRRVHAAHTAEVWRALFRLGVDSAAIDDAVQDVFVTAFRRWDALRDRGQRRAWLLGIARNIASRHRRGDARRARRVAAVEPWTTPTVDPEQHAATIEAGVLLQRFLDDLDEDKRAAFVFGELEELDRTALGAALGVNPNTAYSRLAAARRSFVERFDHSRAAAVMAVAMTDLDRAPPPSRSWAAIAAALPIAPVPLATAPAPAATSKLLLTIAGVAAIVTTAFVTRPTLPTRAAPESAHASGGGPTKPSAAPTPPAELVVPAEPPPVLAVDAPMMPRSRPATPVVRSAPTDVPIEVDPDPETVSGVDGEVAVLHAARRALGRGDLPAARSWLDVHQRRWPDGGAMATVRDSIERRMINARTGGDDRQ